MSILISTILLVLGYAFVGELGIWLFFWSQLILLAGEVLRSQISGVGGFIFMSFMFFGIRPVFITLENDYDLLNELFGLYPELEVVHENMLWATLALIVFKLGSLVFRSSGAAVDTEAPERTPEISDSVLQWMLIFQVVCLVFMSFLAHSGRGLYGSALGAFAYDFPNVMQGVQIFGFVIILERYLQSRNLGVLMMAIFSASCFLVFTWLMREVSIFRGFYLAGMMIIGLAAMHRLRPQISMLWVVVPILVFLPTFQILGNMREFDNEDLSNIDLVEETFGERSTAEAYWEFFNSSGDINIFDTMVAARESEPTVRPYAWSWIYAPLHIIPRTFWSGKPEKGITQDLDFMNGAPYSPGIAGFFWLDGGSDFWMLLCMILLGAIIGYCDKRTLKIRDAYMRACIIAVITVNAMFLTRFFLWQALWQILYVVVPILFLNWLLITHSSATPSADDDPHNSRKLYS